MLRHLCRPSHALCVNQCRPFSTHARPNDEENRDLLASLKGGAVNLLKNESTGVATILLDNPTKKNAMTGSMMVELCDIVEELELWEAGRAVLLYGSGGVFCSGGDLQTTMGKLDDNIKGGKMCGFMQKTLNRLFHLPLVSAALIQGNAIGGGAEVATACDFRLMSHGAKLGWVQGRMGLTPGWGGGARLVELVGRTHALDLLTSSRILTADQAVQMGLANAIVTDNVDESIEDSMTWLTKKLPGSPEVIQAAKRVVLNGVDGVNQKSMDKERRIFMSVWQGPAHVSAVQSQVKHK